MRERLPGFCSSRRRPRRWCRRRRREAGGGREKPKAKTLLPRTLHRTYEMLGVPTVAAVYDRRQSGIWKIAGGHFLRLRAAALALRGPPLQYRMRSFRSFLSLSQRQLARAVANAFLLDTVHVEHLQEQISGRSGTLDVLSSAMPPHGTADQHVRHALVTMQVAVRHVACPENQRVIEQARIAIGSRLQLRKERRKALHMITVNFGPILDNGGPFTM